MLGNWLELSVHAPDVLSSLQFYKALGFHELETGDVRSHRYAVVSDGNICIGLHDRELEQATLTFVRQEVARHALSMSDAGYQFSFVRVDEDVFNELGFEDRDGHLISMIEARTFTAPGDDLDDSRCGRFFELTLPVRDVVQAGFFWAPLAPVVLELREEPTMHMRFDAGGMALGLSESIALNGAALCFRCESKEALESCIEQHALRSQKFPGYEGAMRVIEAPEGTRLYVFDEDFLGEAYQVTEEVKKTGGNS